MMMKEWDISNTIFYEEKKILLRNNSSFLFITLARWRWAWHCSTWIGFKAARINSMAPCDSIWWHDFSEEKNITVAIQVFYEKRTNHDVSHITCEKKNITWIQVQCNAILNVFFAFVKKCTCVSLLFMHKKLNSHVIPLSQYAHVCAHIVCTCLEKLDRKRVEFL